MELYLLLKMLEATEKETVYGIGTVIKVDELNEYENMWGISLRAVSY